MSGGCADQTVVRVRIPVSPPHSPPKLSLGKGGCLKRPITAKVSASFRPSPLPMPSILAPPWPPGRHPVSARPPSVELRVRCARKLPKLPKLPFSAPPGGTLGRRRNYFSPFFPRLFAAEEICNYKNCSYETTVRFRQEKRCLSVCSRFVVKTSGFAPATRDFAALPESANQLRFAFDKRNQSLQFARHILRRRMIDGKTPAH